MSSPLSNGHPSPTPLRAAREAPNPAPQHREQPIEKAARLIAEDRVTLSHSARVYLVAGDADTYRVIADDDGIFCPCKARTPMCSHVLAVAQSRQLDKALEALLRRGATR